MHRIGWTGPLLERRRHGEHQRPEASAALTIVSAPAAAELSPTATLKSPSLFGAGPGRRARCSSALAAQSPPLCGPGELPFGPGVAPRSQNAPVVRGKPKWRRAVTKWSVFEAGVRTHALLPSPRPQGVRCVCVRVRRVPAGAGAQGVPGLAGKRPRGPDCFYFPV